MDISKLELNKEYTWREICELINIKHRSGKGKQIDLKKLKGIVEIEETGKGRGKKYIIKNLSSPKLMGKNFQYNNINNNIKIFSHKKKGDDKNIDLDLSIEEYPDYKEADWNLVELSNYVKYTNNYIDSFSAICRLLNIKYTTDPRTRKKILDYLGNFFEIEKCKKGRGFIVTNIISTNYIPMIKQGKYDQVITDIFLDWLIENNVTQEHLYKNDIFCILDFCSSEFKEYMNKQGLVAKDMNLNRLQVEDYFSVTFQRMNNIMSKALNNMYRLGLLSGFELSYMLVIQESQDGKEEVGYRPATCDERDYIQYCIAKSLVEFENPIVNVKGFGNKEMTKRKYKRYTVNDIPKYQLENFNIYVLELVQKKFPYIKKYYSCHAIRFNKYTCQWYLDNKMLNPDSKKCNDLICNALLKTFENNHNKAVNGITKKRYKRYNEVRLNLEGYIDLVEKFNRLDK